MKATIFMILFFIKHIHSYCIYNEFVDNSILEITQVDGSTPASRVFHKKLNPGEKACCPYTQWDCANSRVPYDGVRFRVQFTFPRFQSFYYYVSCYSGGAIAFQGGEKHFEAICVDDRGIAKEAKIVPGGDTSWL